MKKLLKRISSNIENGGWCKLGNLVDRLCWKKKLLKIDWFQITSSELWAPNSRWMPHIINPTASILGSSIVTFRDIGIYENKIILIKI